MQITHKTVEHAFCSVARPCCPVTHEYARDRTTTQDKSSLWQTYQAWAGGSGAHRHTPAAASTCKAEGGDTPETRKGGSTSASGRAPVFELLDHVAQTLQSELGQRYGAPLARARPRLWPGRGRLDRQAVIMERVVWVLCAPVLPAKRAGRSARSSTEWQREPECCAGTPGSPKVGPSQRRLCRQPHTAPEAEAALV
jgi:hypothetical protein